MSSETHIRSCQHEEVETIPGFMLWELFITIRPVFYEAFQRNRGQKYAHYSEMYVANMCLKIQQMFFPLRQKPLDHKTLADPGFSQPLNSLLKILERLAPVRGSYCTSFLEQNKKLHLNFANLMVMKDKLNRVNFSHSQLPNEFSPKQDNLITELSPQINFFDLTRGDLTECASNIRQIKFEYKKFCDQLVQSPLKLLRNTEYLKNDEVRFIKRANKVSSLAQKLYSRLAKEFLCREARFAQLHLSGFLSPDATNSFEVYISTICGSTRLHSAAYRWVNISIESAENYEAEPLPCAQHKPEDQEMEQEMTYSYRIRDNELHQAPLGPTLNELIFPQPDGKDPQYPELETNAKAELQFLIACSLLKLDGSYWTQSGLNGDKILLRAAKRAYNLSKFWKPHIACTLLVPSTEEDENLAISSFGLLLMEIETGKVAPQIETSGSSDNKAFTTRQALEWTLKEWAREVNPGYISISKACLRFSKDFETFYDPQIDGFDNRSKRAAAIYKYIVAPLFRVLIQIVQNVRNVDNDDNFLHRTKGFPLSANNSPSVLSETVPNSTTFDDSGPSSPVQQHRARKFMEELLASADYIEGVTKTYMDSQTHEWDSERPMKVRIAILDTGIDFREDALIDGAKDRIKGVCSFTNDLSSTSTSLLDCQDSHGHGTHIARLILQAAPSADIFIAKISDGSNMPPKDFHRIARAITWAIEQKVDIISISCGTTVPDETIDKAIETAIEKKISIFAATSNYGGNKERVYPSSRRDGVLAIHASDGFGNDGGISPTPLKDHDNFSTLGIGIPSTWQDNPIDISGTSYATPIAAALAANMLELARCKCDLSEHQQRMLRKHTGVRRILKMMVGEGVGTRDGYDYIAPEISKRLEEKFIASLTKIANGV